MKPRKVRLSSFFVFKCLGKPAYLNLAKSQNRQVLFSLRLRGFAKLIHLQLKILT